MVALKVIGLVLFGLIALSLFYLLLLPLGAIIPINRKYQAVQNGVDIFVTTNFRS